jgi:hypothetical protein
MERIRLYLDDYIYPRDIGLNIIDINIENSLSSNKASMRLSAREFSIKFADFFTAYKIARKFHKRIRKIEGQELEDANK